MTKKEEAIKFCIELLMRLQKTPDEIVQSCILDKRKISHCCAKELMLVDGAMQNVGEDTILGMSYELRINIWDNKGVK